MNWTKKIKNIVTTTTITIILYTIVCFGFYYLNRPTTYLSEQTHDTNTIRATYPNYSQEDSKDAVRIFTDYAAPGSSYRSFVGYRRNEYNGESVSVGSDGIRKSINHNLENSVWFFGGSTMWGTGADDARTIPSYFAKKTGEAVLNLGESSYISIQELIQLQIMLLEGHMPKEVVFYDGFNDGYTFCQNTEDHITHSYTSRFKERLKNYDAAIRKLAEKPIVDFERLLGKFYKLYQQPLIYFRKVNDTDSNHSSSLLSDIPIKSMDITKKYLYCDDPDVAAKAANLTIKSWRSAAALLGSHGIPVWFVLQPTASYKPNEYKLDHIINSKKQAIINERKSYETYYQTLKSEFYKSCDEYQDCSFLIDLSELFVGVDDYIFIDRCHVSPNGNKLVSSAIVNRIR